MLVMIVCPVEHPQLPGDDGSEINLFLRETRQVNQVVGMQQFIGQQRFWADQVGIAGKGGETLVR